MNKEFNEQSKQTAQGTLYAFSMAHTASRDNPEGAGGATVAI